MTALGGWVELPEEGGKNAYASVKSLHQAKAARHFLFAPLMPANVEGYVISEANGVEEKQERDTDDASFSLASRRTEQARG